MFEPCEICGAARWNTAHRGAVRHGAFGSVKADALVARCAGCGVERLAEEFCLDESAYETEAYRAHLRQELDTASFTAAHDEMQLFSLRTLWPMPLRGLTIADVGCAGGSFLDHVRGLAGRLIAVEPCSLYHQSLAQRGFTVFDYAEKAAERLGAVADLAVSFQVVEHTRHPREFLSQIRRLLKPGGHLLLSTPNREDFLMKALPQEYPSFFYRAAHRWYFDAASLTGCAERAGFALERVSYVQRYTLSNALLWLRDRRPSGRARIPGVGEGGDAMWQSFLESTGQADCLYLLLRNQG